MFLHNIIVSYQLRVPFSIYSSYTPLLRNNEGKAALLEDVEYSAALPFDNDKIEFRPSESDKIEQMEEVIEVDDLYHIVNTELDLAKESIRSSDTCNKYKRL